VPLLVGFALLAIVLFGLPPALRTRLRISLTAWPLAVFASPLERPG
jgi:hypothetical protein